MQIVKRYSNCYILKDIVTDVDHNDCFNDHVMDFNFPDMHKHWVLGQYKWDNQFDDSSIHEFIFNNIEEIDSNCIIRKGFHEIGHGQAIPPHSDINHIAGLTIFLNQEWEERWGGHNVCMKKPGADGVDAYGDSIITAPSYGMGVLIIAPCVHFTLPVFEDKKRRTIQYFYDEKVA